MHAVIASHLLLLLLSDDIVASAFRFLGLAGVAFGELRQLDCRLQHNMLLSLSGVFD